MTALLHSIFVDDGDDGASAASSAAEDAGEDVPLPEALAQQAELAAEAAEAAPAAASEVLLRETSGGQGHPMKIECCPDTVAESALLLPARLTQREAAG